jgi:hypothetical protein
VLSPSLFAGVFGLPWEYTAADVRARIVAAAEADGAQANEAQTQRINAWLLLVALLKSWTHQSNNLRACYLLFFQLLQVAVLGLPWEYTAAYVRALIEAAAEADGAQASEAGVEAVEVAYREDGKSEVS